MPNKCVSLRIYTVSGVNSSMESSLTILTLRHTFELFSRHVTAVITVKTHSPVTGKYKMANKCVSLRNCTVSCIYSFMEPNLTVLTLGNILILCLRHMTFVITVKTDSLVAWKYKMPKRCVPLRNYNASCIYSIMKPNLTVGTLRNTFVLCLRHVTSVKTVKTHSPLTWEYKVPNRWVSLRICNVSCVYNSLEPNLRVGTL